jgi:hypothetical protein
MKPTVNIPREKLVELLQASGSTLTPEEYTAALPGTGAFAKFPGRARAAAWSKNILIFVLLLSVLITLFDFGVENIVILIGLGAVTFFETRVHRYFWEDNIEAPTLGFRNQCCFAVGILIYGLYHALFPGQITSEIPAELREYVDAPTMNSLVLLARGAYLVIGIVGGISQFGLACYYRSALARDVAN